MKYLKLLLLPFSVLYGTVTAIRNFFYNTCFFKAVHFDLPVLAVGNLTVGGTGKSPHVEYLIRLLQKYKLATLSRGYKRNSKGFILANAHATADLLGDEPYQYHRDFPEVTVAVCEKRVEGIQNIQKQVPAVEVVILDDAMQHRAVKPSLLLLLSDYGRPFFKDFILPAGLLRESRGGARRADAVVVSKCPQNMSAAEMQKYTSQIKKYTAADTPVFFSTFAYGEAVPIGAASRVAKNIVLLTGIANPQPLQEHLKQQGYTVVTSFAFPDHHAYTMQDMFKVKEYVEKYKLNDISIVTTSKDAVKLTSPGVAKATAELPLFYLPIQVRFLEDAEKFDGLVLRHVQQMLAK